LLFPEGQGLKNS